jgi:hypothetical protein
LRLFPAGFVDDVMGWDFVGSCADAACSRCTPGPDPTDMTGWGTHAAAVIAAQPEVASGTAGIAPGVRVMALKAADCRAGMQLGDWAVQQQELGSSEAAAGSSARQLPGHSATHPVLLASAAVQAFDYALLNGAHVVLAGWRAGSILDDSSSSDEAKAGAASSAANATASTTGSPGHLNCVLGADAGEITSSSNACLAAVQQLLFVDALQPLEEAGVLVVTMHPDDTESTSGSGSTSAAAEDAAAAPIPCSLGLELSNVLCVASAPGDAASSQPLDADMAPAVFFQELIYDLADEDALPPPASTTDSSSSDNNATDSSSANSTDTINSGNGNATAHYSNAPDADDDAAPDQETNTITSVAGTGVSPEAGVTRSLLLAPSPAALLVPGRNIMGGWAWGGHAAVSGGSAAAAVAAGAAALIWSNLGLTLGAEASGAAAHEGLGQLVKQMLIEGGSSSSKAAGGSGRSSADRSSRGDWASAVARNPMDALRGGGSSNSSSSGKALPMLNLLQAQQLSNTYPGKKLLRICMLFGDGSLVSGFAGKKQLLAQSHDMLF